MATEWNFMAKSKQKLTSESSSKFETFKQKAMFEEW
jgi:hypothetical protein